MNLNALYEFITDLALVPLWGLGLGVEDHKVLCLVGKLGVLFQHFKDLGRHSGGSGQALKFLKTGQKKWQRKGLQDHLP